MKNGEPLSGLRTPCRPGRPQGAPLPVARPQGAPCGGSIAMDSRWLSIAAAVGVPLLASESRRLPPDALGTQQQLKYRFGFPLLNRARLRQGECNSPLPDFVKKRHWDENGILTNSESLTPHTTLQTTKSPRPPPAGTSGNPCFAFAASGRPRRPSWFAGA